MARIMAAPAMCKHTADLGLIPFDSPSVEGITGYLASEREKWGALVKKLGLEGSQ
jgi:hypothetical protein